MDAVAEHRARPKQPRAVIDVEVALRAAGKKRLGYHDLGLVLVEMRLDISLRKLAGQRARRLQLLLGSTSPRTAA